MGKCTQREPNINAFFSQTRNAFQVRAVDKSFLHMCILSERLASL